jgi:hypothetical protein
MRRGASTSAKRAKIWPLYVLAETARRNGDRDSYPEERLHMLMIADGVPRVGERRLILPQGVFDVSTWIRGIGVPVWLIYKNAQAWACAEALSEGMRYNGAIHVGAEPVDPVFAHHVFLHAA